MNGDIGSRSLYERFVTVLTFTFVTLLAIAWLFPFVWAVIVSFKDPAEIVTNIWALPERLVWENYVNAFHGLDYMQTLGNSLIYATSAAVLQCVTGTLAAFAFARIWFPGRGILFMAFLATLMIPTTVTLTANFLILARLGWIDTFAALIVPHAASGFAIFLLRQFFLTIPKELQDAATMDGAGPLRFLWNIVVPLSRPALTTVFVFVFIVNYNDFLWPLIMTSSEDIRVVQISLSTFTDVEGITSFGPFMAAAVLTLLPTVLLFGFLQRAFVRGITRTGLK